MELFSLRKIHRICPRGFGPGPPVSAHGSVGFIKRRLLATGSRLLISAVHHRSDGWGDVFARGRRVTAERGGSPEFKFSRATVVGFRWGLFLRDHSDEGNSIMLTLIGGEWQQSPTMVRRLGRCLVTVRAASGEASAPRTCAKASSSSLLASRLTNCSKWQRKTQIWWLTRVRRVLDLRPKICTKGDAIYRVF
jgi:hypothetical protein